MFVRSPDTAWQDIEDKTVIVTPRTKKIHIISGSGRSIWSCLEKPQKLENIVELLCGEYEVSVQQARDDVSRFIQDLVDKKIVKVVD